eukprot:PhM_4_TR16056/c0_g3_i1/m.98509
MAAETKLAVAYNVFDSEELLESSIVSIRRVASYVIVVYQTISNYNMPCEDGLVPLLEDLKARGLIDELIHYTPHAFDNRADRMAIMSQWMSMDVSEEDGMKIAGVMNVNPAFLNELTKRQLGLDAAVRLRTHDASYKYFMSMDCDEYYLPESLTAAIQWLNLNDDIDVTACYMRYFFKRPQYELLPLDDVNCVSMLTRLDRVVPKKMCYMLAHPYPMLIDPTRRLQGTNMKVHCFLRDASDPEAPSERRRDKDKDEQGPAVEMYHYSFVRTRQNIVRKLMNVSNRGNYGVVVDSSTTGGVSPLDHLPAEIRDKVKKMDEWEGVGTIPHPHPTMSQHYKAVRKLPNLFNVPDVY